MERSLFSRRRVLSLGLAATTALLAACGTTAPPTPAPTAKPAEAPGAQSAAAKPPAAPETTKPAAAAQAAPTTAPPAATAAQAAPAAAAAPTSAPAQSAAPAAGKRGGTMRVGLSGDLITMDPHLSGDKGDRQVYFNVYNALVGLDENLKVVPELAESWEQPDPKTYVFKLRKGVKFHDGTDFDAQAVKVNFERMMNPDTKSLRRGEVASIDSVQVVDPSTVRLNLKAPNATLPATLTDRAGMMISPAAIEKYGKDLARNPVGTGPFKFVEWVKDDHLTLRRNDNYWRSGFPLLDEVRYRPILDESVKLAALKGGEIDVIDYAPAKDVATLKADSSIAFVPVKSLAAFWFWLNTTRAPFDNKAVRQAVALSLDIKALVERVRFGVGVPATGPIPPSSWAYDASLPVIERDLAAAKAKLAEAGKASGVTFAYETGSAPESVRLAQVLKAQLAEAGMDVDIQLVDGAKQQADTVAKTYDFTTAGWSGRPDPDGNTFQHFHSKGGMNYGGYNNPKVDELLERGQQTTDQAERKKIYSDAAKIIKDDAAAVFWLHPDEPKAASLKVQGYRPIPDGMIRFEGISFK